MRMKVVYAFCILLTTTVCGIASGTVPAKSDSQPAVNQETTTPFPPKASTVINPVNGNATAIPTNAPNATTTTVVIPTKVSNVTENGNTTTAVPVTTPANNATTSTTTTTTTTTTTAKPTTNKPTSTTTAPSTTSTGPVTVSPSSVTTAVPISTKVPPSSTPDNERHFNGLSFMGGMILAFCATAIGTFAYKTFNRTMNERNYRTL